MKTHTIAAVAGLALALCSQAEPTPWFNANIANLQSWPTQDWSNTENTTFSDGAIKLENVTNNLTYTYTASPSQNLDGTSTVVIKSSMLFTAYDSDEMPEPPSGIKAGLIVVDNGESTSYYGLVTNVWTALTGATPDLTSAVEVTMSLLPGKVQYKVGTAELTAAGQSWLASNSGSSDTVSQVLYNGTGEIHTLAGETDDLPAVEFTLTWPSGLTPVSYSVDGGEVVAISGSSPVSIPNLLGGEAIAFVVANADGAQKTLTGTAGTDAGINATGTTFAWPEYLGVAVNGAYTIDDANDLDMLRKGVDAELETAGVTFKQTANIDMSTAGAFAGIGEVGAENATTLTMTAFEGTYDGGNYTISNITFTNRKGSGLFNLIRGATIKDLVVDTVSYEAPFAATKLGGAMVVGNGVNCTLQHIVTRGSNGLGNPSTYNAGGIANRLEGRGGPVLVIGCTNNAAIYGCYSKVGGICPIVQGADQTVTFVDCANTGNIVANGTAEQVALSGKTPGVDGAAGILGYTQGGNGLLSFTNCVNTGTITGVSGTKAASILGYTTASGIVAVGGSAQADLLSVNTGADKVTGLKFATVENGVATFVADDALALNGSYKVMSGSATATFEFTEPGSIAFDTALATPTYAITAAQGLDTPTSATSGTVTTYTAAAPAGIDPANGTTSVEVQAESAAAATNAVAIVAPTGVDAAAYKALFTFEATAVDGKPGYYEVELVGIKDEVVEAVNADAVNVFSGDDTSVSVPAGLFYRITPSTSLPISAQGVATQSTGTVPVQKPGTTQGFLQVELSATPFGTAVVE